MSLVPQRASSRWKELSPTPRWKEWIPLISQQQRLRNMVQVAAYNVPWYPGSSLYFTLHETTMSSPFYTSECLQHQHPKWGEMDMSCLPSSVNTSAKGLVMRLWLRQGPQTNDKVVLVWGFYFSGLVYLGPRLAVTALHFNENAVVLHMQGGYFTDYHSLKEVPSDALVRNLSIWLPLTETRPSYSVSLLLRLRNIQQAIKKLSEQSGLLREKILAGGTPNEAAHISRESNPTIRRLLSKGRPKPQERQETLSLLCQVEMLRFRVALLRQEKANKLELVSSLEKQQIITANENADRSCNLTERYQNLHKKIERLRDKKCHYNETREALLLRSSQLSFRRKKLMSLLSHIYPVTLTDGKYRICGIHLPNSEELSHADDISVSVALGFVAHLVQMVSIFLQVPLRYPIIHFGSRSKIIDHITEKIPDREREFPLFARGKDKIQFHYGVYLLNKNIAQLRWLVGFPTNDLRATLHNVYHLLHLNQFSSLENHHRSLSGSSLDVVGSSVNVSPVGSVVTPSLSHMIPSPNQLRSRHRSIKSMGSTEGLFPNSKRSGSYMSPPHSYHVTSDGLAGSAILSYSLDKGLDEYEEIKRSEDMGSLGSSSRMNVVPSSTSDLAYIGSEPNLVIHSHSRSINGNENTHTVASEVKVMEGRGTFPSSSDDDAMNSVTTNGRTSKSEFTLVTESLAKLVDSSKTLDIESRTSVMTNKPEPNTVLTNKTVLKEDLSTRVGACDLVSKSSTEFSNQEPCEIKPSKRIFSEESQADKFLKPHSYISDECSQDILSSITAQSDDIEVDVGTDALADISYHRQSSLFEFENGSTSASIDSRSREEIKCDQHKESEQNRLECVGVEESVLVDNLFANVTSRTEALASHATSFNLMSSRHGST